MQTLALYLDDLASADPTPGGGSAACVVAAHGAALVAMVARITLANPRHAAVHALAGAVIAAADHLRAALLVAQTVDEAAYGRVALAMALPKATLDDRSARTTAMQSALAGAAEAPLDAAALALEVLALADRALQLRNAHLVSDLGCAAAFASASIEACGYNVRVNHAYLNDAALIAGQRERFSAIELRATELRSNVTAAAP
ncbi:MAG: cyclodeaminase/cyclohydrolase family protein [Vulcanimicrobiaceae bacterium]